jgi:hypothetical protein
LQGVAANNPKKKKKKKAVGGALKKIIITKKLERVSNECLMRAAVPADRLVQVLTPSCSGVQITSSPLSSTFSPSPTVCLIESYCSIVWFLRDPPPPHKRRVGLPNFWWPFLVELISGFLNGFNSQPSSVHWEFFKLCAAQVYNCGRLEVCSFLQTSAVLFLAWWSPVCLVQSRIISAKSFNGIVEIDYFRCVFIKRFNNKKK